MDKKLTGSFYTPEKLIEYMVNYAQKRITPQSILEPSAGDGRFVEPLRKFECSITLVELEESKTLELKKHYSDACDIYCSDFLEFSMEHGGRYDLIIGNPPYISKKVLPEEQRELSLKIIEYFELDNALFQNIWVSFILASLKILSPHGAIFFVLPFEFLQVQYAEKLREFLESKFNTIEITTFEDRVFTEIEQDICLVYLSNEEQEKPYIKYTTLISETNTKQTFESVIMRNKPLKKWSNCILNDTETEEITRISNLFPKIESFGDISPGIVTGANSFFILSKEGIDALDVGETQQIPIITKGSTIPPLLLFRSEDFSSLERAKIRTYLLNLNGVDKITFSQALNEYITDGEKKEIHKRYKCKKRTRWYDVPIIKNGEACFFKRFHRLPKIIVNSAGVYTTDIVYNIRFKPKFHPASFAFCFYNSLTLALCEYNGRFYGGGVGELVPNEFKALSIPYRRIEDEKLQYLDALFRKEASFSEIIDYVDAIVLNELPVENIELLQEVRNRYLVRRMKLYKRENDNGEK